MMSIVSLRDCFIDLIDSLSIIHKRKNLAVQFIVMVHKNTNMAEIEF